MRNPRSAPTLAVVLVLALGAGCAAVDRSVAAPDEVVIRAPGPVALESDEHMESFLAGGTFRSIPGRKDAWAFGEDRTFEARYGDDVWTGRWRATGAHLHLTELRIAPAGAAPVAVSDRTLPLRWLDGKLNIEIDGRQFRSSSMRW